MGNVEVVNKYVEQALEKQKKYYENQIWGIVNNKIDCDTLGDGIKRMIISSVLGNIYEP